MCEAATWSEATRVTRSRESIKGCVIALLGTKRNILGKGTWCSWLSHPLSMRGVPGSIPGVSKTFFVPLVH